MRHFLSKLLAGGLSAGVILIWWPLVFPSDSLESWLVRGICWTFCFELMMHSFAPLEEALWRTRAARKVAAQAQAAGSKLPGDSTRKRISLQTVAAGVALLLPVALLASAPAHRLAPKPASTQVREVTQIKRIVRVERRSVTMPGTAAVERDAPAEAPVVGSSVEAVSQPATPVRPHSPARAGRAAGSAPGSNRPSNGAPRRPSGSERPSRGSEVTPDAAPASDAEAPSAGAQSAEPRQRAAVSG